MDRRNFLGLIPMAGVSAKIMAFDNSHLKSSGTIYRGYRLHWTGWKAAQAHPLYAGQWLAHPVSPDGLYDHNRLSYWVSLPGGEGYFPGDGVFDLTPRRGQVKVDYRTPDAVKERERRKGLRRLLRLIDTQGDTYARKNGSRFRKY